MESERTEAIVLKGVDFSESSRIVTLLTPDRGRMACIAKGVKRPTSRMAGLLDTFNRLEVVYTWKDSRSVQTLIEASALDGYAGIKGDLDKSSYGAFLLELALVIVHENEPSEPFYAELSGALNQLDAWRGEATAFGAWATLRLLSAAGFEPVVDACSACGEEIGGNPGFVYEAGAVCGNCAADRRLSQGEYKTLKALSDRPAVCPNLRNGGSIFELLGAYAGNQLEARFRSLGVIRQLEREPLS